MAYGSTNVPGASDADVKAAMAAAAAAQAEAQGVSDKLGATGDTGGSASTGTVFGKLNKIIGDIATHMGRWTATRAGYIDTIKADVEAAKTDAAAAKANTAANNTAKADGTLSQKLSHIIAMLTSGDVNAKLEEIAAQGVVKSVQYGITKNFSRVTNSSYKYVSEIVINAVNPQKCFVILNSVVFTNSIVSDVCLESLAENILKIGTTVADDNTCTSWQVIEFY